MMISFCDEIDKIPVAKGFTHLQQHLQSLGLRLKPCEHSVCPGNAVFHIYEHHSLLTISELRNSCAMLLEGNVDDVQTPVHKFLDRKKLSMEEYCSYISKDRVFADEIVIYLLS